MTEQWRVRRADEQGPTNPDDHGNGSENMRCERLGDKEHDKKIKRTVFLEMMVETMMKEKNVQDLDEETTGM